MRQGSVLANDLYLFVRLTIKLLSFEKEEKLNLPIKRITLRNKITYHGRKETQSIVMRG